MRLLWISKLHDVNSTSGDAVFDRKLEAALRERADIVPLLLSRRRLGSVDRVWSVLNGRPYDRREFQSADNRDVLAAIDATDFDVMVVSHEALDWAVDLVPLPAVLIYHNVSSRIMDQVISHPAPRLLVTLLYRHYESSLLRRIDSRTSVITLSSNDAASVEPHTSRAVGVLLPGVPDLQDTFTDGASPVLHVVGSQEWAPKRRDLAAFLRAWNRKPRQVQLDVAGSFRGPEDTPRAATFGLVADRFDAGFKLKIGEYIAHSVVPVAMVDVYRDLRHLPFSDEFLVVAANADDAERKVMAMSSSWNGDTTTRFRTFRDAAMELMTWSGAADSVLRAADNLVRQA